MSRFAREAAAAEARTKQDDDIGYCMRRRDEAEREIRDIDRRIAQYRDSEPDHCTRLEARRADLADRLAYYEGRIAALGGPRFGPHNVKVGDYVRAYGWHKVVRVNRKTVTVPSLVGGSWTDTIPWDRVTGHRPAEPESPNS